MNETEIVIAIDRLNRAVREQAALNEELSEKLSLFLEQVKAKEDACDYRASVEERAQEIAAKAIAPYTPEGGRTPCRVTFSDNSENGIWTHIAAKFGSATASIFVSPREAGYEIGVTANPRAVDYGGRNFSMTVATWEDAVCAHDVILNRMIERGLAYVG